MAINYISSTQYTNSPGSATNVTFNHTTTAATDCLVLFLGWWKASNSVLTAATYNGINFEVFIQQTDTDSDGHSAILFIKGGDLPTAGTYTVSVTFDVTVQHQHSIANFSGVNQSAPFVFGSGIGATASSTTPTVTVPSKPSDIVVACAGFTNQTVTHGSEDFEIETIENGTGNDSHASWYNVGASANTTINITISGSTLWTMAAASLQEESSSKLLIINEATASSTPVTTLSFSLTISGNPNRKVIVCGAAEENASVTFTGCTFNSSAMTEINQLTLLNGGFSNVAGYYEMLDADLPAAGTYTVALSMSSASDVYAYAFEIINAKQELVTNEVETSGLAVTSISQNITTAQKNSLIISTYAGGGSSITITAVGAGQSLMKEQTGGVHHLGVTSEYKVTPATDSQSLTFSGSVNRAVFLSCEVVPILVEGNNFFLDFA